MGSNKKRIKPAVWQDIVPARQVKKPAGKFAKLCAVFTPILKSKYYITVKKTLTKTNKKVLFKNLVKYAFFIIVMVIFYVMIVKPNANTEVVKTDATELVKGTPSYDTFLPLGKTISELGGWTRISPPESDPVFAYVDKIGDSSIIVSQQPLPDGFDVDTEEQVDQLAQSFKAREKITIGDTTIHIGTSAKGPQSIIFSKNGLLILIKSTVRIDNDQWVKYVNSLD